MGAGSADVSVAKQLVEYYTRRRLSEAEARNRLAEHKQYFARADNGGQQLGTLDDVMAYVRPSALVGLAAMAGVFTERVVRALKAGVDAGGPGRRPILFPLSNPLSKAECTFEQAVQWTDGAAIFASGSPFQPVTTAGGATPPEPGQRLRLPGPGARGGAGADSA